MPKPVSLLLLEDSALDAELVLERLTQAGIAHHAQRVETETEFTSALRSRCPDLILADYSLPQFDGLAALRIARERCPEVPFLLVYGAMGEEIAIHSLQQGATDYVPKRRLERLAPAVRRALGEVAERAERQRAEAARRATERELATVLANVPAVITRYGPDRRVRYINAAAERQLGGKLAEFAGRTHAELGYPPELATQLDALLDRVFATGQEERESIRFPRPNGTRDYDVVGVPEQGDGGEVASVLMIAHDVTERRRAEEALRRSNEDLQQFAWAASHDLQEPLRMITAYTQLLEKRYAGQLDATAHEYIQYAVNGAARLEALVRDLRLYWRVTGGDGVAPVAVDMGAMLERVIGNLRSAIDESGAVITHDALPVVTAHDVAMVQLFQNLLSNAIKYRRQDAAPRIHVAVGCRNGCWEFSVSDNGIGIPPEHRERVFGLFKRLHANHALGTGMGLAICRRIVERHDGRIWVESAGEGSTFRVTLPTSAAETC